MFERSSGKEQKTGAKTAREHYPYPEDWRALQGGKPRVFRRKFHPGAPWMVVHVYEDWPDSEHRFQSGIIVPTTPPEKYKMLNKAMWRKNDEDKKVLREFMIPSFMDRSVHGDMCQTRSDLQGGDAYDRIKSQKDYVAYFDHLNVFEYEELRFGVNDEGFTLTPVPNIKPPRPIES